MSNEEASQRIADDAVDILVDLKGWAHGHRAPVLAQRPAAVQIGWLGYPGPLGASWMDYMIADNVLIPPGHEAHFSEKIIHLPDSYQANDNKRSIGKAVDRGACGLPTGVVVFCSFNAIYKLTPKVFDIWLKLLHTIDQSILWLIQPVEVAATAIQATAIDRGIDPHRIVFAPWVKPVEHLARAGNADLALDSFPCGSHTTASDMLWAGVPLVALMGDTFASRVSASVLTAAGLPDLIATSFDDYFRLVVQLAGKREELAKLKMRVREQRVASALFDTQRFTRNLERAYSAVWERHCRGLSPDHINVKL